MSNNMSKKIGKATAWSSVTEVVTKLILPIVNIILARLLTPEAFGVVATINMVISFAEVFADAGFQKYLVQHEFETEEALNDSTNVAFWTNLGVSSFICIIIFFFRHQIAKLVGNPELGNSISIASVAIILAAFSSIQMARYKREFDFKTLFFVRLGTSLIPLFVTIPLAVVFRNYWALLIGTLASQAFSAVILTIKSKWKPRFYYRFQLFKEMFSFSVWTLLESISVWLTSYIGVFVVGNYLNDYYLGLYKTSMSTVNSYMAIISSAITPVLFSALSRYQQDNDQFKNTYFAFQRLTSLFVIPMGVGLFLFSDLVTQILLGSQWMEASGFIGLWALTSTLTIVLSNFASEVYRSKGHPQMSLIKQVIHLAFLIPTLIIAVKYGFKILYTARALVRIQGIVMAFLIMHFRYQFKFWETVKNIFPMILSSLVMGSVGYGLRMVSDGMAWQFVAIIICVIIYFVVLFLLFPKIRKEVLGTLHAKRRIEKSRKPAE